MSFSKYRPLNKQPTIIPKAMNPAIYVPKETRTTPKMVLRTIDKTK